MKKENPIETELELAACKKKLTELEPYIEKDEAMAILYNQTLVDKAVLSQKIRNKSKNTDIFDNIRRLFTFDRKNKKICDYFMK